MLQGVTLERLRNRREEKGKERKEGRPCSLEGKVMAVMIDAEKKGNEGRLRERRRNSGERGRKGERRR